MTSYVNARVTPDQLEWLIELADARYEGNVSMALRQAVGDARLLERARESYRETDRSIWTTDEHGQRVSSVWDMILGLDVREEQVDES